MKLILLGRIAAVVVVTLLVLLALALISGKIHERRKRADAVEQQFAAETTGPQVVAGPFLVLTCERTWDRNMTYPCPTQFFTPRKLSAIGTIEPDVRSRGIYQIRAYRSNLELSGDFEWPAAPPPDGVGVTAWKHAYLVVHVSDTRGIKAAGIDTNANSDPRFAIRYDLGPAATRKPGQATPFALKLEIVGTTSFAAMPVGDSTEIRFASPWPHPSFTGGWSPDERRVSDAGFEAVWRLKSLATGGQSRWRKALDDQSLFKPGAAAAGVALYNPVNIYTLSYRATEYGFLFVMFTFAGLALAEVLAGVRIHAIQYLLVGTALAVFFLLLIALSEHIAFGLAYAGAAMACIALLTIYLRHPLGSARRSAVFFAWFSLLYGSLYVLLKQEDHALLMGSLMVFTLLAFAMLATRKVDWNALSSRLAPARAEVAG